MSTTNPPSLGVIITNPIVRKGIYGTYVVALVAAGATQVGFAAVAIAQPDWLTAALAVLAYLGIPVGSLALANTSTAAETK